jgi:Arc/MetJ family transcription regulator
MRTTLIIDDELLAKAQELSGLREKPPCCTPGCKR